MTTSTNPLCWIDCETTGLDPRIHQPYEVCFWREDRNEPAAFALPHTLEYADQQALEIGGYFDREFSESSPGPEVAPLIRSTLAHALRGVTLVGANPGFDAAMLTGFIGTAVWHYRMIDVESVAMSVFGWDRPKGLSSVVSACRAEGFEVPEPSHTAEADVRATRAVHEALVRLRAGWTS